MEDQTNANTEELEPTSGEAAVANEEADTEANKKNGRTLKLKAAEQEATAEAPAEAPPNQNRGVRKHPRAAPDEDDSDVRAAIPIRLVKTP